MMLSDNVISALAAIRRDLPGIGKDSEMNDGGQHWRYRGIEAVAAVLGPLLGRHGVVLVPHLLSSEPVEYTTRNGSTWTEWRCLIGYTVYGPGGRDDSIEAGPVYAIARDASDKGIQKTMTSAFKQLLVQMFCIGDSADDIDQSSPQRDQPTPAPNPVDQLRADGWASLADWTDHRDKLNVLVDAMGPELAAKFRRWCDTEGLRIPGPRAHWERAYAKALEKVPIPTDQDFTDAPPGTLLLPSDTAGPPARDAERSLAMARLVAAGVTAELLTKPEGDLTEGEHFLLAQASRGPDGLVLADWADSLSPTPVDLGGGPPQESRPPPRHSPVGVGPNGETRGAERRVGLVLPPWAPPEWVDNPDLVRLADTVQHMSLKEVARLLESRGLDTTGQPVERRRRLALAEAEAGAVAEVGG